MKHDCEILISCVAYVRSNQGGTKKNSRSIETREKGEETGMLLLGVGLELRAEPLLQREIQCLFSAILLQ